VRERRRLARHPARVRPELVATGPGQVFSWDITKLAGPVKGKYFDAYVMIDIYSRYIVKRWSAAAVHHRCRPHPPPSTRRRRADCRLLPACAGALRARQSCVRR
jgi:hypothetical protein